MQMANRVALNDPVGLTMLRGLPGAREERVVRGGKQLVKGRRGRRAQGAGSSQRDREAMGQEYGSRGPAGTPHRVRCLVPPRRPHLSVDSLLRSAPPAVSAPLASSNPNGVDKSPIGPDKCTLIVNTIS